MPTRPNNVTLTNSSVDVLNAIRNSASTNYRNYVPIATTGGENVRTIGAIIMDYPALQNEFLSALINRIAKVMLSSKLYENPWSTFKKGILEFGETIEEIFVDIARVKTFNPAVAEEEVFKREIPDVKSAFHILNYQKFYKSTISDNQLKQAFLSLDGVTNLIAKIVDSMYTGANYDEYQVMKYMLAKSILNGRFYPITTPAISSENSNAIVTAVKGASNNLTFMSTNYNPAGVHTYTDRNDQYVIIDSRFEAIMNVNTLATAFNMDKADFMGHTVMVDGFGNFDITRLNEIFTGDPTYTQIGQDELTALSQIPAVIVDKDFFMIFDNLLKFTEIYNSDGLYWNYAYHTWKTFSISPFANAIAFVTGTPEITAISVNPSTATISKGSSVQLTANVTTEFFAPQSVDWTSDNENVTVSKTGYVSVSNTATAGTVTITATSTFDPTKKSTATITVS